MKKILHFVGKYAIIVTYMGRMLLLVGFIGSFGAVCCGLLGCISYLGGRLWTIIFTQTVTI